VKTCSRCKHVVADESKFCPQCGYRFPQNDETDQCGMYLRFAQQALDAGNYEEASDYVEAALIIAPCDNRVQQMAAHVMEHSKTSVQSVPQENSPASDSLKTTDTEQPLKDNPNQLVDGQEINAESEKTSTEKIDESNENNHEDMPSVSVLEEDEETSRQNKRWPLYIILAIVVLAGIGLFFGLNHSISISTSTNSAMADSVRVADSISSNVMPTWLPGTYAGTFNTKAMGGEFSIEITIGNEGSFKQVTVPKGGKKITMTGKVDKWEEGSIRVRTDDDNSHIKYPVDRLLEQISIGNNLWLGKK